ncbi:MAG: glycosyltransferase family 1 protein [Bacteroidales bacterium]|nr:glycosyltransferase family 1 protein [Bacteroidales bacterium]
MTLLVNGRFLTQQATGVHRFAYEICRAFTEQGIDFTILVPNALLCQNAKIFKLRRVGHTQSHLWEQVELPWYVHRHYRGAVLLNLTGLSPIVYSNSITTIHDLSFLENPHWFSFAYRCWYRLMTPISAKRAHHIFTVSEFSKQEIERRLHIKSEKITVVYNAVSEKIEPQTTNNHTGEKYLLAVSSIEPRKNLLRLLQAFKKVEDSQLRLYVVGAKHKVFAEVNTKQIDNDRVVFTGYLTPEQLYAYYANACVFAYPSLYEGFGIPVLEAMHFGCPVLASDIPPLHEVANDSALYCNPYDVDDIAEKLNRLMSDETLRQQLSAKGKARSALFSWQKSAHLMYQVISRINKK